MLHIVNKGKYVSITSDTEEELGEIRVSPSQVQAMSDSTGATTLEEYVRWKRNNPEQKPIPQNSGKTIRKPGNSA